MSISYIEYGGMSRDERRLTQSCKEERMCKDWHDYEETLSIQKKLKLNF